MSTPAAAAVRLERTLHDFGTPASFDGSRRNLDGSEPLQKLSNPKRADGAQDVRRRTGLSRLEGYATVSVPCRIAGTLAPSAGLPPEVFHNCGKKCGKARIFALVGAANIGRRRIFEGRRPKQAHFLRFATRRTA